MFAATRGLLVLRHVPRRSWLPMMRPLSTEPPKKPTLPKVEDDEEEYEEMFVDTPIGKEWGGPMRGGRHPEPTRYGDWERKGRASDF